MLSFFVMVKDTHQLLLKQFVKCSQLEGKEKTEIKSHPGGQKRRKKSPCVCVMLNLSCRNEVSLILDEVRKEIQTISLTFSTKPIFHNQTLVS